jgi:hypothetical protein
LAGGEIGEQVTPALTDEKFRYYAGIWFLCEYITELLKAESASSAKPWLERKWLVYFAFGEALRVFYRYLDGDLESAIAKLANPQWNVAEESSGPKAVLKRYFRPAVHSLRVSYESAAKIQGFTHRNWFRDKNTLSEVRSELEKLWSVLSESGNQYSLR